jgi:uncharacterized protein (UPF0248 family)
MTKSSLACEILLNGSEPLTWIPLKAHPGYEITNQEPFVIRKFKNNKWQSITPRMVNRLGYYHVKLETNIPLHRVIAEQFIDNPDKLPRVEHTNRNKTDNRLSNIRWVNYTMNMCNKSQIKGVEQLFIDTLPEGYEPFSEYVVHPEHTNPITGEIVPADIRKLPDLYMKWEVKFDDDGTQHWTPRFITFDSKHQFRSLQPDKYNRNCCKYHDENGKVCSLSFRKIPRPEAAPPIAKKERPPRRKEQASQTD